MKGRRWLTWLIFGVCALAVFEAVAWMTLQAMKLEDREREARAEAQFQDLVRLALWRMESEVTPILAQESARPYFHYRPFYGADRAYTRMWQEVQSGEVLVPSPLLEGGGAYVKLYFQVEPDGRLTSPQAPVGEMRDRAESQYVDPEFLVLASERLGELESFIAGGLALAQRMPSPPVQQLSGEQMRQRTEGEQRATSEYAARQQAAQAANTFSDKRLSKGAPASGYDNAGEPSETRSFERGARERAGGRGDEPRQGSFEPLWVRNPGTGEQELILHRRLELSIGSVEQGMWMDWPALRLRLRRVIGDLLPGADLAPAPASILGRSPASHLMASIPVLLDPGPVPVTEYVGLTPTKVTLGVTWLAVLTSVGAIGVVLRKSMELSDRRGRFVSAVTHELRTPLTTFCMYTEMLADGMVQEEETRRGYLGTLKAESSRLAGIVENVLEYARLGGKKPSPPRTTIFARDLVSRIRPSLERCAERCSMTLVVDGSLDSSLRIAADVQTVERILLNLVDNACKYAGEASDRRVHLGTTSLARGGRAFLELRIRDHGPGIPERERKRIFKPFHRARREANGTKSGLGLGLALSRGLARELGGDLVLGRADGAGAEFVLTLPA